jgi:hypothetical protein
MPNSHPFIPCQDTLSCPPRYHQLCHDLDENLGYSAIDIDPYYLGAARSAVQDELELLHGPSNPDLVYWLRTKLEVLLAVHSYEADHESAEDSRL